MLDTIRTPIRMVIVGGSPPWVTVIAVIAVIVAIIWWVLARAKSAEDTRKRRAAAEAGHDVGAFQGEGFEGHSASGAIAVQSATEAGAIGHPSSRDAAWSELFDPATTADRLAQIAAAHPEFAAQLAAHANAYPELRAWAVTQAQP